MSIAGRIMLIAVWVPIGLLFIVFVALFALSPGKLRPFVDEKGKILPNSISEKIRVNINGIQQGMIIRGRDTANPVLLFLHGGTPPGVCQSISSLSTIPPVLNSI